MGGLGRVEIKKIKDLYRNKKIIIRQSFEKCDKLSGENTERRTFQALEEL